MLQLDFVRAQFPALQSPWALMDNAGGSAPCVQVIEAVRSHMQRLPVQLGASYELSVRAGQNVATGRQAAANLVGAEAKEIVLGASSSVLLQQLARCLSAAWQAGDEVIVTNLDHEANIGPWRQLEACGIVIREWRFRADSLELDIEDLERLLGPRTRLVAFTHCSNLVGSIHAVARICSLVRAAGALSCVDGVAYAPHRRVDVKALGADFYLASLYKVYGPHLGLMYGRLELLLAMRGAHHFFVPEDSVPNKLEAGNVNFELAASLVGIEDYMRAFCGAQGLQGSPTWKAFFEVVAEHEASLIKPLLEFLVAHPRVRLLGNPTSDSGQRVPTISFVWQGHRAGELPALLDQRSIAIRYGHFYAYRFVRDLGLMEQDGVVRISLVHYNSPEEVLRLISALEQLL